VLVWVVLYFLPDSLKLMLGFLVRGVSVGMISGRVGNEDRLGGGSPGLSLRRQPLQFLGISLLLISVDTLLMGANTVVGSYDIRGSLGRQN